MLKVINPATGELFNEVEATPISDLTSIFESSQKAQKKWKTSQLSERKEIIASFVKNLLSEKEECARILSCEMGKPFHQAVSELESTASRVEWFLHHFEECVETKTVYAKGGITEKLSWDPLGTVLNISAWNFPYFIGTNVFVPALLTGNSVLYKPSEICPFTGLKIRELLLKSGLNGDLFQTVIGGGSAGQTLLEYPLNGVFFTGSYETGKKIAGELSGRFIKTTMELGGKDAAYVCYDANLESAVSNIASGVFYNAGQSCCSVERLYLHEKIYEQFLELFYSRTMSLVTGDPMDPKTYMGPLARKEQISFLDAQKEDALEKGACELVSGGAEKGQKGWFYKPTVFLNANHNMALMKEESFGPMIGIMKVKDDEEAMSLMDDTNYGLTGSVHTSSLERGEKILNKIDTGTVFLNTCDRVSPNLPWSGRRNSGLGSTLSSIGIQEFVRPKSWQISEM